MKKTIISSIVITGSVTTVATVWPILSSDIQSFEMTEIEESTAKNEKHW